ncbi:MAG: hypothetical protein RQ731_06085 [Anaerosomatales bacterium]|nr:hypothetical protein [Anaerosomatales bacterium]MDT8434307.1 hypothetical protein [Anaerosomatales bacterium]
MRVYVAFDDTDNYDAPRGTGKLARWFGEVLPTGCQLWGVVRQQLLVHPDIPYTSHNSSACVVLDADDRGVVADLIELASRHLEHHMLPGSDPGLCVVTEEDAELPGLIAFGNRAASEVVTQADAKTAAGSVHLSGHGGTNDGIIGAAAGVGLTAWGWSGRFVEFGDLREYGDPVSVLALEQAGMLVVPVDRNVVAPRPDEPVATFGWLRPRLWGGRPVVPVMSDGNGGWVALGKAPLQLVMGSRSEGA